MKRNFFPRVISLLLTGAFFLSTLSACKNSKTPDDAQGTDGTTAVSAQTTQTPDTTAPVQAPDPIVNNLSWPEGQIFPTFPAGSGNLDVITDTNLNDSERIAYTCLQGIVNANETRMALYVDNVATWAGIYGYKANRAATTAARDKIVKKYASEIKGVVLYSTAQTRKCADFVNLATTVANVRQAIPVTEQIYNHWKEQGIDLPVAEDLTGLTLTKPLDVYQYLYDNYWEYCTKRILFVQSPDYHQMRDYASATGAAMVYLSCKSEDRKELALFKKFLADLTPGESILMGWNGQEKELMTTAAAYGLSCVPADFFSAPSVFAQNMDVQVNPVPDMPRLENKIYIAFYFSDGDNIQYNMNAMKEYWDNASKYRGQVPVNWTISPALAEIAPGMMNYYYNSATAAECFVCGPSGLGYTVPVNTFGATVGNAFKNDEYFAAYVRMTNGYLAKSGLRMVTIWDNLSDSQRKIYSDLGSYLYGLSVQHFTIGDLDIGYTGVTNNMLIQQMTPAYFAKNDEGTTTLTELGEIDKAVKYLKYDGTAPVFISCQVSVWAFHDMKEVIEWEQYLSDKYAEIYGEDVVEFVRADHYYNLYYQANGLPYDLTLRSDLTVSASSASDSAALVADGTQNTVWEADGSGEQDLLFDLAGSYSVSELSVFFAESAGGKYTKDDNVKALRAEISADGKSWTTLTELSDNTDAWVNLRFDPAGGRYLRITVTDPGKSGIARIADVNIKGVAS